ncbi:MAG: hypothetical protein ACP5OA_05640 [Candidatus Woesearchaeota archaeon]
MHAGKYLLTVSLAMAMNLNIHDMKLESNIPEQYPGNIINKEIQVRTGSGTCYENISRKVVERSLDNLCKKADKEDAWLYWNNTLIDIGILEDSLTVALNEVLIAITLEKAYKNDTITIYHIHPYEYVKNEFSPPSSMDIWNHGAKKQQYTQYKDKNITVIQRMLNGSEMWEFDVEYKINRDIGVDEGNDRKRERLKDIINQIEKYQYGRDDDSIISRFKYFTNITLKHNPELINEYIHAMNGLGVILKYTPSNEL